jgi:hypothetical protein
MIPILLITINILTNKNKKSWKTVQVLLEIISELR